jgi:uncharacterized protein YegP (UPF0339 family)
MRGHYETGGKRMRAPRVEVYRGKDKKWYWRMRAGNGKIVADGSQGYASKAGGEKAAKKLMEDIQLASADIEVEVLEG